MYYVHISIRDDPDVLRTPRRKVEVHPKEEECVSRKDMKNL